MNTKIPNKYILFTNNHIAYKYELGGNYEVYRVISITTNKFPAIKFSIECVGYMHPLYSLLSKKTYPITFNRTESWRPYTLEEIYNEDK